MIKEVCEMCEGYGFIEICAGLGPKIQCPVCSKEKSKEQDNEK